jgi:hypothetical protein
LAILKGARNGLVYGVKIRFPHALIMSILFGRGEYVSLIASPCQCSSGRLPYSLIRIFLLRYSLTSQHFFPN